MISKNIRIAMDVIGWVCLFAGIGLITYSIVIGENFCVSVVGNEINESSNLDKCFATIAKAKNYADNITKTLNPNSSNSFNIEYNSTKVYTSG